MTNSIKQLVLHAPNIHSGGGGVLLRNILAATDLPVRWAQLDARIRDTCQLPLRTVKHYVNPSVTSRLLAEWRLRRNTTENDVVLCFHSLPPLLPLRGQVVIFVQNRLLIEQCSFSSYPLKVRVRLWIERLWSRALQDRCSRYIVQTPTMAALLRHRLQREVPVSVMPFVPSVYSDTNRSQDTLGKNFDFVYVASGEPHKNHRALLEAWRLLAVAGLTPSLALTVNSEVFPNLSAEITRHVDDIGLSIVNVGQLQPADITNLYRYSAALIFPSKVESFGLPLIEASRLGLPILASELDYVRDLVYPAETFDPNSPVSISRAVRRFLKNPEPITQVRTAKDFLEEVLK